MPIERQIILAGEVAATVAKEVAPNATAEALGLLATAERRVATSLPSSVRSMAHIGPNNGLFELETSVEPEIMKARAYEAGSHTPYAKPDWSSFPQLHGTQKTDTLVVGGGMTGLSVANRLAANGVKTILVDAGHIGEKTSQFAGGMITRAGDPSFVELEETYGAKTLERFAKGMVNAHQTVMRRAAGMGDKVDFVKSDSHQISYNVDAMEEWIRGEHQAVSRFDHGLQLITGPKAKQIFEPAEAVMTFKGEGQLNPLKYTKLLGQTAQHPIFENTPIIGLEAGRAGGPITALTANGGRIEANRVVFATGSGGNLFRSLDSCVEGAQCFAAIAETKAPVRVAGNIFDTDGAVRDVNGLIRNRNTEGAYNYFRKPADSLSFPHTDKNNLMLFGGADKVLPHAQAARTTVELEEQLQTLFPGAKTLHQWTGLIEESVDGMPIIAHHAELPQVIGIRGVGGSGIDSSQFVADELAKVIKGGDSVLSATRFAK